MGFMAFRTERVGMSGDASELLGIGVVVVHEGRPVDGRFFANAQNNPWRAGGWGQPGDESGREYWAAPHRQRILKGMFCGPDVQICDSPADLGQRLGEFIAPYRDATHVFNNVNCCPMYVAAALKAGNMLPLLTISGGSWGSNVSDMKAVLSGVAPGSPPDELEGAWAWVEAAHPLLRWEKYTDQLHPLYEIAMIARDFEVVRLSLSGKILRAEEEVGGHRWYAFCRGRRHAYASADFGTGPQHVRDISASTKSALKRDLRTVIAEQYPEHGDDCFDRFREGQGLCKECTEDRPNHGAGGGCGEDECMLCGLVHCGEPLYFHHDGCPASLSGQCVDSSL